MTANRSKIAPFVGNGAPLRGRQKPRAFLASDLARELDERLRIARLCRTDHDHGTTIP